ncbi:MAG: hypothetical protein ACK5P7_02090 [Bdellovibrio sp.]|jgi:hypothetical protein
MKTRRRLLDHLQAKYPELDPSQLEALTAEHLVSDHVLKLPRSVWHQAQIFILACQELRHSPTYQKALEPEAAARQLKDPGNEAIAMSYDFHLGPDANLKLIEINTNASFLALSDELYESLQIKKPNPEFSRDAFQACIETELESSIGLRQPARAAIIDEAPQDQKLFIEFLVYQQWFKSWGWTTEIKDSSSDLQNFQFVYNRDTDFYLEQPRLNKLRALWLEKKLCLSPHPYQYLLLADKQRQVEWFRPGFFEDMGLSVEICTTLRRHLPFVHELNASSAENLWAQKKSIFIKPKRSFGAKQTFRGGSVSRKMFDHLISQDLIAQEFVPAPEIVVDVHGQATPLKYDLRFYTYKGEIQTAVARLYQGQVTNLRTPGGGFAPIMFEDSQKS